VYKTALDAGEHLISQMPMYPHTVLEAERQVDKPLTGFSHGAAGFALALLKLAATSKEERLRQAAQDAIQYERSVFLPQQQNWPDFRVTENKGRTLEQSNNNEPTCMCTWCHGAPGIGLARLAGLKYLDDATIREEIAIALNTTVKDGFGWNHSLCHGDLGNLEVLLMTKQVLGKEAYQEQLQQISAMILNSIDLNGCISGVPSGIEIPGLMTGIAGIGYGILRLAEPRRVPSVLALEAPYLRDG
jgi:lantibiotic modifying enzyme